MLKPRLLNVLLTIAVPTMGTAGPLDEPHLNISPRTQAEAARIATVTALTSDFDKAQAFEENSAGAATVRVLPNANAFSQPSGNISFEDELTFKVGNGLFKKIWVFSPASTLASDGLGPLYNARSCQRCHIKDGRGATPKGPDYRAASMFLRISTPGETPQNLQAVTDYIGTAPDPTYGGQLQDFSPPGIAPGSTILRTMDNQDSPKLWPMRISERSTLSTAP